MDSRQANATDEFPASSGTMPSAFLSPPISWENRRDSITSSQSSYCQSFASSDYSSVHADYSVPVTPIFAPSPGAQDGFVDVMSYDLEQGFQGHVVHGLPHIPEQKEFIHAESICEPFVMVQHRPAINSLPYRHQGFPISSTLDAALNQHVGELVMDVTDASSTTEPAWDNISTFVWPDARAYSYHQIENNARVYPQLENRQADSLQMIWDANATHSYDQSRTLQTGTIIPSETMAEDFVMVDSEGLDDPHLLDGNESAFPQTPQEVSFKREETPLIKNEPDSDSGGRRFGDRVYRRKTGAKGVKKERRSAAGSTRQARRSKKASKANADVFAYKVSKVSDGCYDFRDYQAKKREDGKWFRTDGCTERKQQCEKILPDGTRCTKSFKRQEHMKRHLRTHLMVNEAWCKICKKGFNRNDNCIAHYETHLAKPGGKPGRNRKMTLREMEEKMMDERADVKMIEKIREKCRAKHPEAAVDYELL